MTQQTTDKEAARQLEYIVLDCQLTGLFKSNTEDGSICLLESIYPETKCQYLGEIIHCGLDYYKNCKNCYDFKNGGQKE